MPKPSTHRQMYFWKPKIVLKTPMPRREFMCNMKNYAYRSRTKTYEFLFFYEGIQFYSDPIKKVLNSKNLRGS